MVEENIANGYNEGKLSSNITVSKLSALQRSILRLALRNRIAENRTDDSSGADCYYSEIMFEHFGFPPERADHLREHPGSPQFDPHAIGERRYASASAAISRAAKRLEARGLVTCVTGWPGWSGVSLTPTGIQAAKK